jgi:hypothetical protein
VLTILAVHGENERLIFDLKFLQLFKRNLFCFPFPTADQMENIEDIMKVTLYYFLREVRTGSLHKEWLFYCVPALPQLGCLTAGLSPGRPGFHPRAVYVRCVVDEVAMVQDSLSTSVFHCLYHSTIAPYSSSSTCCSY